MSALLNQPLVILFLKNTLLLLAAMVLTRVMRRASSAARHIVWASAIAGVLFLPLLSISLPTWQVTYTARPAIASPQYNSPASQSFAAPAKLEVTPVTAPAAFSKKTTSSHGDADASMAAPQTNAVSVNSVSHVNWLGWLTFFWATGAVLTLARFVVGLTQVARAKRESRPLEDRMNALVRDTKALAGVRRTVDILRAAPRGVAVPITWGVLRPVILLPAQSVDWSDDCLRTVLLHELAHIARWDWLTHCTSRLACALYWFHPLVWFAARQAREASERACDDCVLQAGVAPTEYAQRLIDVLKSLPAGAKPQTVAIAMALPRETEGRIRAILAAGLNRRSLGRKRILAAAILVAAVVFPVSALRPLARTYGASPSHKPPMDLAEAEALIHLAGAPMPSTPGKLETRRRSRGILTFVYLREVACQRDEHRPVTMNIEHDSKGREVYAFHDARTKKTFHDGAKYRNLIARSPVIVTDADVVEAQAEMSGATMHEPSVRITFGAKGMRKFAAWTKAHVGELLGIVVDGRILSAPNINTAITGTDCSIAGSFHNLAEAQALAARLNAGAKPAPHIVVGSSDRVVITNSDTATLASGAVVHIAGVRRAVRLGKLWDLSAESWKNAQGDSIAAPDAADPIYWTRADSTHWTSPADPWAKDIPTQLLYTVQSPVVDYSEYREVISGSDTAGLVMRANHLDRKMNSMDRLPPDAKSCSIRIGVATAPWQTVATLPVAGSAAFVPSRAVDAKHLTALVLYDQPSLRYVDKLGGIHVAPMLPGDSKLGNVARRLVAVYRNGETISLDSKATPEFPLRINYGIYRLNPKAVRKNIVSVQLQIRPYEIVEFHGVSLKPRRN
ncbi:MAG: M56 family metallopeptidase [Capsulimonas sp.]|uniref:M56 family metallopeptidase n=1 Tax=Capsulimonas sp. TaxID=2494211 RepID=UPI003266A9F5